MQIELCTKVPQASETEWLPAMNTKSTSNRNSSACFASVIRKWIARLMTVYNIVIGCLAHLCYDVAYVYLQGSVSHQRHHDVMIGEERTEIWVGEFKRFFGLYFVAVSVTTSYPSTRLKVKSPLPNASMMHKCEQQRNAMSVVYLCSNPHEWHAQKYSKFRYINCWPGNN